MDKQVQLAVTFYTKAGCHLCDDARELLEAQAEGLEYVLTEIDIRRDPALFEEYRYRIPVMRFADGTELEGRIEAEELARALAGRKGE